MLTTITIKKGPADAKRRAEEIWAKLSPRVRRVLRRFRDDTLRCHIRLEEGKGRWDARGVISLPRGTVVGKGRGETLEAVLDDLARSLFREARRYKERFHADAAVERKRRRVRQMEASTPDLGVSREEGDPETFFQVLRPVLASLSQHAEHELRIAELEGRITPGSCTTREILDEVMVRAWDRWSERPDDVPLERWLTGLLHETVDARSEGVEFASLEERVTLPDEEPDWDAEADTWFLDAGDQPLLEDLIPDEGAPPYGWAEAEDERDWILSNLASMPRPKRRAYLLFSIEGWEIEEIALLQGRSADEVRADVEDVRAELERRARAMAAEA